MFKLKENGTKVSTEILAGLTTFVTMAYIIAVNPAMLSLAGMEWGAVFLATIIASIIGTLIMGLVANVPYAQAPGMGLNALFVFTVCFTYGFSWQHALSMVFICGVINILITVTKIRKHIIKAIPKSLQNAIGGGIGIFIAYIGLLNVGAINFGAGVPSMSVINTGAIYVFIIGLVLTIVLLLLKVKGAILIGIVAATLIGIPLGVTTSADKVSFIDAVNVLPTTLGVIFTKEGLGSLFSDVSKLPIVLITIFAMSLSDTFDTIGTFIGTGRQTGIFSEEDEKAMESSSGFKSKMDKALFADATATSIGAIFGTSNTTTYVESAAGIAVGGRTGLTSVVVAICFALSAFFASFISSIPGAATAPALVVVGIMMLSSFKEIQWSELEEAIPAFFAGIFMALAYSITTGIAMGFIFYLIVKVCKRQFKDISPVLWVASALFILNFVLQAII
ncbi:MAG TPA: NCS2 family permease [Clostridia bacterium]|jgi:AGZA family xanthine/uracil permease-like MFS transporter|nr:NCS2 family permease [Clostridiaceae bacterium]HOF26651.1 NCS2 family permease [Clostridia bacterium]HOM34172.1 NCS2 family permease [Clostridia bacterium]HOR89837.1 NCS2 family permease [Clostridia bacterium]HOT71232.1 NCS2 family permease [Clostridia bacterium]